LAFSIFAITRSRDVEAQKITENCIVSIAIDVIFTKDKVKAKKISRRGPDVARGPYVAPSWSSAQHLKKWISYATQHWRQLLQVQTALKVWWKQTIHTGTQLTPSSNLQLKKLRLCLVYILVKFCCCHKNCDNLR